MDVVYGGEGTFINSQTGGFQELANIELNITAEQFGTAQIDNTYRFTGSVEIESVDETGQDILALDTGIAGVGYEKDGGILVTMTGQGVVIDGNFTNWNGGVSHKNFREGKAGRFFGFLKLINASPDLPAGVAILNLNNPAAG